MGAPQRDISSASPSIGGVVAPPSTSMTATEAGNSSSAVTSDSEGHVLVSDTSEQALPRAIRCKAAIAFSPSQPVSVAEIEVDVPQPGEARVRMLAASVCPTDVEALGGGCGILFPCVLGHEGTGVVESVGSGVRSVRPGDLVVCCFLPFCARCRCCRKGKGNTCEAHSTSTIESVPSRTRPRLSQPGGGRLYQFLGCSTFAEYTLCSEFQLARINKKAPPSRVSLLSCSVATGLGAVLNVAQVEDGESAAVFGINTVGLAVVEALRISNASRIIVLDLNANRLSQARAWGATDCINLSNQTEHPSIVIRRLLGAGVDYAFDCIGTPAVSSAALESCSEGWGTTVLLGTAGDESSAPSASVLQSHVFQGKVLKGALLGGYRGRAEIPLLVEKYMQGHFRLDGLVRDTVPLSKIQHAIEHARRGEDASRVVIEFVQSSRPSSG